MYPVQVASRFSQRSGATACALGAGIWLLLLVASPYIVSRGPGNALLSGAARLTYLAGGIVCHQRPDRSFHAWGIQLPVCGRCFGLYAAALGGALWAAGRAAGKRGPAGQGTVNWARWLVVAAVPTVLSFGLEATGVWVQSPVTRAVAAAPLGFAVAWFIALHAAEVLRSFPGRV